MAPAGADRPFLGTNPFAVAVATGKLEIASREGRPIPEGWGVDRAGETTTDPAALADGGWLLPLGSFPHLSSHKGFALALVVEVLSGLLGGGPYGPGVQNLVFTVGDRPARVGHFFGAIDPARFGDPDAFTASVSALLRDLHRLPATDPARPVMTPGEPEWLQAKERSRDGIPLQRDVLRALLGVADEYSLPLPTL